MIKHGRHHVYNEVLHWMRNWPRLVQFAGPIFPLVQTQLQWNNAVSFVTACFKTIRPLKPVIKRHSPLQNTVTAATTDLYSRWELFCRLDSGTFYLF